MKVTGNNPDTTGIPGVTAPQVTGTLTRGVMANRPNVTPGTAGPDKGATVLVTPGPGNPGGNLSGKPGKANPVSSAGAGGTTPGLKEPGTAGWGAGGTA